MFVRADDQIYTLSGRGLQQTDRLVQKLKIIEEYERANVRK